MDSILKRGKEREKTGVGVSEEMRLGVGWEVVDGRAGQTVHGDSRA
jgi:hypothetical protein